MPAITDLPIQNELGYEIKTQGTTDTTPTTYTYSGSLNGYVFRNDGGVNITFKVNSNAAVTVAPGEVINSLIPISSFTINAASGVASWTMRAFELFDGAGSSPIYTYATLQSAATAIGNGTILDVSQYSTLVLNLVFSGTATVITEGSVDGTNWDAISGYGLVSGFINIQNSTFSSNNRARYYVAGIRYFRARISAYTSGTVDVQAECTSATMPFQQPTINTNADGTGTGYHPINAGYLYGYNGTTWDRIRTGSLTGTLRSQIYSSVGNAADVYTSNSDGVLSASGLVTYTYPYLFNGNNFDRQRNNIPATGLSSAARTASTSTADITNYNHRGIVISLNVTAASGTGGLQVTVQAKDNPASVYKSINTAPTAVTAAGQYIYMIYPGIDTVSSNNAQNVSQVLPQTFRFNVAAGDASSYTYSITYQLIV